MDEHKIEEFQNAFRMEATMYNVLNHFGREGKCLAKEEKKNGKWALLGIGPYVGCMAVGIATLHLDNRVSLICIGAGSLWMIANLALSFRRQSREIDPPKFSSMDDAEEYYLNLGQVRYNRPPSREMFIERPPKRPHLSLINKPNTEELSEEQEERLEGIIEPHLRLLKNEDRIDERPFIGIEETAANLMFLITPGLKNMGINMPKVTLTYDQMVVLLNSLYEKAVQKDRVKRFEMAMLEYVIQITANLFSSNPKTDTDEFTIYTLLDGLEFLVPVSLKQRDGFVNIYGLPLSEAEAEDVRRTVIETLGYNNVTPMKIKKRLPFQKKTKQATCNNVIYLNRK